MNRRFFPASREKSREEENRVGEKSDAEGKRTRTLFPCSREKRREEEKIVESGRLVPGEVKPEFLRENSLANLAAAALEMEHTMLAVCTRPARSAGGEAPEQISRDLSGSLRRGALGSHRRRVHPLHHGRALVPAIHDHRARSYASCSGQPNACFVLVIM
jgi:hypothetical protein